MIYNLEKRGFSEIPIKINATRYSFAFAWIYDRYLWCMTYRTGNLLKCNLDKNTVERVYTVYEANGESAWGEAIRVNDFLYFVNKEKCIIYEFDLRKEKKCLYTLSCDDDGFGTILNIGEEFYLTGHKRNIYQWDKTNNEVKKIEIGDLIRFYIETPNFKVTRFLQSKRVNEYVVLIPNNDNYYTSDDVLAYNIITKEIKIYHLNNNGSMRKPGECLVFHMAKNSTIFVQDYTREDFWKINLQNGKIEHELMKANKEANEKYWMGNGMDMISIENDFCQLGTFIKCL